MLRRRMDFTAIQQCEKDKKDFVSFAQDHVEHLTHYGYRKRMQPGEKPSDELGFPEIFLPRDRERSTIQWLVCAKELRWKRDHWRGKKSMACWRRVLASIEKKMRRLCSSYFRESRIRKRIKWRTWLVTMSRKSRWMTALVVELVGANILTEVVDYMLREHRTVRSTERCISDCVCYSMCASFGCWFSEAVCAFWLGLCGSGCSTAHALVHLFSLQSAFASLVSFMWLDSFPAQIDYDAAEWLERRWKLKWLWMFFSSW